jgi:hypothetical protein
MDRGEPAELGNLHDIIYPEVFGNSRWPEKTLCALTAERSS